jgi:hypothetical protein
MAIRKEAKIIVSKELRKNIQHSVGSLRLGSKIADFIEIWITSSSNGDVITLQDLNLYFEAY